MDLRPINQENNNQLWTCITLCLGITIISITATFIIVKTVGKTFRAKNYTSYENFTYGIVVERPKHWSIQEENSFLNPEIIFLSPKENNTDTFREQVKLYIEKLAIPLSLNEYTELAVQKIVSSNSIIEPPKNISFANQEGRKVIYQDPDEMKRLEVWTIKNQKAYIITYTAEADKFQKFAEQAETIIQSLEIK
ncbi:MAG: hypothetical protein AB4372_10140 [Xenococcus sp. (in: cyanobacteria)]